MNMLTRLVLPMAAVCVTLMAQTPAPATAGHADVDRLLAYFDWIAAEARYGFEGSIRRVAAEPAATPRLSKDFEYLKPFLDGKEVGPLATFAGAVRGSSWYLDTVDRRFLRAGQRERLYHDGRWTVKLVCASSQAVVVRRYFDPGLGVPPWLLFQAGTTSVADLIRAAASAGRLELAARAPATAEEAGSWRLHLLRFVDASGSTTYELEFQTAGDRIQVGKVMQFRGAAMVTGIELEAHQRVGEWMLPTEYRVRSTLETVAGDGTAPPAIVYHWQITYRDRWPDPASFLDGLQLVQHLRTERMAYAPLSGLEHQIDEAVAQILSANPVAPTQPPAVTCLDGVNTTWPELSTWTEAAIARSAAIPLRDAETACSVHLAVVACARMQGVECSLSAVLEHGDAAAAAGDTAIALLARCGLDYVLASASVRDLTRLRDPFLCITEQVGHNPFAEAAIHRGGKCHVWSLRLGRRTLETEATDGDRNVVISRRDAASLGR
jgi:hypothetical protein